MKRFVGHAHDRSEVLQDQSLPIVLYPDIVRAISGLGVMRRPPAIPRSVVSVNIDTIKSKPRRAWSHVRQKSREIVFPAFTHLNASTSIMRKSFRVGIVTSVESVLKGPQFSRMFTSTAMTVSDGPSGSSFDAQTSAASSDASPDGLQASFHKSATITPKGPPSAPSTIGHALKGNQTAISLARNINLSDHDRIPNFGIPLTVGLV